MVTTDCWYCQAAMSASANLSHARIARTPVEVQNKTEPQKPQLCIPMHASKPSKRSPGAQPQKGHSHLDQASTRGSDSNVYLDKKVAAKICIQLHTLTTYCCGRTFSHHSALQDIADGCACRRLKLPADGACPIQRQSPPAATLSPAPQQCLLSSEVVQAHSKDGNTQQGDPCQREALPCCGLQGIKMHLTP